MTTIAGIGERGGAGDGGPADAAQLYQPVSVTATQDGQLYISDAAANHVRRVATNGIIETVAGNGERGSGGDGGLALEAQLNGPVATRVGPDGTLYIAEFGGNQIRAVGPDGLMTTVVGTGEEGFGGDGGVPRLAHGTSPSTNLGTSTSRTVKIIGFERLLSPQAEAPRCKRKRVSNPRGGRRQDDFGTDENIGKRPWAEIPDSMPGWEQDLHETHPPLRDRIALARRLQLPAALPADNRPARVLLESLLSTDR